MPDYERLIDGLTEIAIFLAISCYTDDPDRQEKIIRMGFAINDTIEVLRKAQEKQEATA